MTAPRAYPSRRALAGVGLMLAIIATTAALVAPHEPTVAEVAAVAMKAAKPDPAAPAVAGVLTGAQGDFTSDSARTDTVGGRKAFTVIYRRGATEFRLTTVKGKPLDGLQRRGDGDIAFVAEYTDHQTRVFSSRDLDAEALATLLR